jgi:Tol biopolymer transport system component
MMSFLRHVVLAALADSGGDLKETSIGVAVYGRETSYDPKIDPVVRNEARRLRHKLDDYYAEEGSLDSVLIRMPKGGYAPSFQFALATAESALVEPAWDRRATCEPGTDDAKAPTPVLPLAAVLSGAAPARVRLWWLAVAVLAACILFGAALAGYWRARTATRSAHAAQMLPFTGAIGGQRPGGSEAIPTRMQPITSYPGRASQAAISPDGARVAFTWDRNVGNFDLYTKALFGPAARLTTNSAQDLYPAWSPDGRWLAFVRTTEARSALMVIPSAGGEEREVRVLQGIEWKADPTELSSPGPVWSRDGKDLVVSYQAEGEPGTPLYMTPVADGSQLRRITNPGVGEIDQYPRLSPDGRWLAFVRQYTHSAADVFAEPANGGEARRVSSERTDIRGLSWMPDSRRLVFSANRIGAYQLWCIAISGGEPKLIPTAGDSATEPSVSPDGSWLAYRASSLNANIWRAETAGDAASPKKLISSSRQNHSAQYSPDGRKIAFISDRSGAWEVWIANADGSAPSQLTNFQGPMVGTPHWSPDGRWIAFDARPEGHSAVYVISSSGGEPRLLNRNSFEEKMPAWSRDGRWLYFNSNREGAVYIWKAPAAGGEAQVVCRCFARDVAESFDGQTLYFLSADFRVWRVPVAGGTSQPVPGLEGIDTCRAWAVTRHGIFMANQADRTGTILYYNFSTGRLERTRIVSGNLQFGIPNLSVSANGRWLIYSQEDAAQSDVLMVRGAW